MPGVARLGDLISHGGAIIAASPNVMTNGLGTARVGDDVDCAIHGVNPIVQGSATVAANGKPVAYLGALCACGAAISTASTNVFVPPA